MKEHVRREESRPESGPDRREPYPTQAQLPGQHQARFGTVAGSSERQTGRLGSQAFGLFPGASREMAGEKEIKGRRSSEKPKKEMEEDERKQKM